MVQALHHPQAKRALAIQHLRDAPAWPDIGLQVFREQTLLIHAEFDGLHRIGRADGVMLVLVSLHQGHQHLPLVHLGGSLRRLENGFQPPKHGAQVIVVAYWLNNH
jgi:hypothetical protein